MSRIFILLGGLLSAIALGVSIWNIGKNKKGKKL